MKLMKLYKAFIAPILLVIISLLLGILLLIQINQGQKQVRQTTAILLDQIKSVIEDNQSRESLLVEVLKKDYTTRAKAVSYILDHSPGLEEDLGELVKISSLIRVDEIHIFDQTGTICAGTHPQYYGYNFDSGEQMGYFKPMLQDKKLAMCQDAVPNTAEGKMMMYAICWNEQGTRMLQVGISSGRLMEELRTNSIRETLWAMPAYAGVTMLVADRESGEILGATYAPMVGKRLEEVGITHQKDAGERGQMQWGSSSGGRFYYTVDEYGTYLVAVVQMGKVVHKDVPVILGIVALYLFSAGIVSVLIIKRLANRADSEEKNATTDVMTGFLNRRAYENWLRNCEEQPIHEEFTYVSMDLNGLKRVNDTLGHDAGDELIKGAALCMRESFGSYGDLFRIGGDEFAAIMDIDDQRLQQALDDFQRRTGNWRGGLVDRLSVSCGCARRAEFPEKALADLDKIADIRMYQAKREYYRAAGMDRREQPFTDGR